MVQSNICHGVFIKDSLFCEIGKTDYREWLQKWWKGIYFYCINAWKQYQHIQIEAQSLCSSIKHTNDWTLKISF